jgi:protein-tyrosine phosphatase
MHSRRLLINSVRNLRELGGYPISGGGTTQWGVFLRSDAPVRVTGEDIAFLRDYGVTDVLDLRGEAEAGQRPHPLMDTVEIAYHNIPFTEDFSIFGDLSFCPRDHYVAILGLEHRLKDIFTLLAKAKGCVLFHCTAGKDRTGIVSALLLSLAGVPREDVMADYQLTFTYIRELIKEIVVSKRPIELCRTEPEWIEPALDFIEDKGGAAAYLSSLGVSEDNIERLRKKLAGAGD